ncbi:hypothetical protein [Rhodococcus sp. USK13]|uniref:hypothetical protein n=1 Tax=Rhodococcus sp. USK13 TaxID=2806442 RepID=UPI002016EF5B|nr:hypothetical protein [Rhodococcus sp. USK13]
MPALIRPTYRYTDPTLTPPAPGGALIMEVGLVFSRPGIGPKGGGQHGGVPLSVGPTTTLLRRHDGIEMRLPNTDLLLWNSPFLIAGHRHGVFDLRHRPGWEWLGWTLADHVMHDHHTNVTTGLAHGVVPVTAGEPAPVGSDSLWGTKDCCTDAGRCPLPRLLPPAVPEGGRSAHPT